MTSPLLAVEDLHVRYGAVTALRGVSLEVYPGEMVALLGANGAGKTTTLRAISGLVSPHAGAIRFDDRPIQGMRPSSVVRLGIGQMPEGRDLFPGLSVEENLRFGLFAAAPAARAGFADAVTPVYTAFPKLHERRGQKAGTLSGGEQQMLTAGIALIAKPRLLLVDELSLGLAPLIVDQLYEVLREVNRQGTAILLVEQFVHLALENAGRAYVLGKGQVTLEGPSDELKNDPALVSSYIG